MSVYFRPDQASKRMRYRASLKGWSYYGNIKERWNDRIHNDYETGKPLPSNKQARIRFHGKLHHHTSHGPNKAAKRWEQARLRWEVQRNAYKRRISYRAMSRLRSYM